jgi:hypothetical protein
MSVASFIASQRTDRRGGDVSAGTSAARCWRPSPTSSYSPNEPPKRANSARPHETGLSDRLRATIATPGGIRVRANERLQQLS